MASSSTIKLRLGNHHHDYYTSTLGKIVVMLLILMINSNNVVQCLKIAFVGDTGLEDPSENGHGHLTMQMIRSQNTDLIINVGDLDYWGRCIEITR